MDNVYHLLFRQLCNESLTKPVFIQLQTDFVLKTPMSALVSIVIPTYNRADVLGRAIESVLQQTETNWELILIDDGSTDDTAQVIAPYLKDRRLLFFKTPNRGVSAARNFAIRQAQAEWIAFLDSDDEWLKDKLRLQLQTTREKPTVPLVHGDEIWIRKGVRVNPMKKHLKQGGNIYKEALKLCCISPSTAMIKKSLLFDVGLFREDFPVCEDYDLWLKITSQHSVAYVDQFLIRKYGGHSDQLSRAYKAMDYWRIRAMKDRLDSMSLTAQQIKLTKKEIQTKSNILLKGYRKHGNLEKYQQVFDIRQQTSICSSSN